jgi:hypothetical protein
MSERRMLGERTQSLCRLSPRRPAFILSRCPDTVVRQLQSYNLRRFRGGDKTFFLKSLSVTAYDQVHQTHGPFHVLHYEVKATSI